MDSHMAVEVLDNDGQSNKKDTTQKEIPDSEHSPISNDNPTTPTSGDSQVNHIVLGINREMLEQKQQASAVLAGMGMLQGEIDLVKAAVQTEPHGSDLRMFLFTVAASTERYESTLVPLPPQFRAEVGSGCQVEQLRGAITNNWPSCRVIPKKFSNDEELLDLSADDIASWRLLHWLLVAHPAYPSFRRLSILHLDQLCRLMGLARPTFEPRLLISIGYDCSGPQEWKWSKQAEEARNYAFLGLPLSQVYRFLYTGHLAIPPGEPIRLYSQLELALGLCEEPVAPPPESGDQGPPSKPGALCWRNSILDRTEQRALIICQLPAEMVEARASTLDQHYFEFFVKESTTLKPCYLLMYDEPVASKMMFSWPGNPIGDSPSLGRSLMRQTPRRFLQMARYVGERLGAFKRVLASL